MSSFFFLFLAVIVFLVVIHELGHFLFAKFFGVKVEEFGIGYPPRAFKFFRWGDTEYTMNWLPFGGFVRLYGEDSGDPDLLKDKTSFASKPAYQKIFILVAGALFNFLFAVLLLAYVYFSGAPIFWDKAFVKHADLVVNDVIDNSPAKIAGLQAGDIIKDIYTGKDKSKQSPRFLSPNYVSKFVSESKGKEITIVYFDKSAGVEKSATVIPAHGVASKDPSSLAIGVKLTMVSNKKYGYLESIAVALKQSVIYTKDIIVALAILFKDALFLQADLQKVTGPVGIAVFVHDAASVSFEYLLYFVAIISLNLAVVNLLPIPALDGGRALVEFVKAIFRAKIARRLETALNVVGFVFLIALMLIVTYNDILRLVTK